MVILIPQLPVSGRYSEYWPSLWQSKLQELGVECTIPYNAPSVKLDRSKPYNYFTNTLEALDFELSALKMLLRFVTSGDDKTILFLDGDFPGLSTPFVQVLKLVDPEVKCYSYVHAGSWCNGDVFSKSKGKKDLESSMFNTFDKVFVATEYHRNKIVDNFHERLTLPYEEVYNFDKRIKIVGFPFYKEEFLEKGPFIHFNSKEGISITGRQEQSKERLVSKIMKYFPKEKIHSGYVPSKDYYPLLSKTKIILSLKNEETFGLSLVEAMSLNCLPLVPNDFSYPEIVGKEECLYKDFDDLIKKLGVLLGRKKSMKFNLSRWKKTIPRVIREMEI